MTRYFMLLFYPSPLHRSRGSSSLPADGHKSGLAGKSIPDTEGKTVNSAKVKELTS